MHIVLETNVLVSGLISAKAAPGRIVDFLRAGRINLVLDDRIFAEYHGVLARPHLSAYFRKSEVSHILDYISHCAYRVIVTENIQDLPDPEDTPFLEVAWEANRGTHSLINSLPTSPDGNSDHNESLVPLVTGNHRHFPRELCRGIQVLSPAVFMESYTFP
jgi:putative PIN family toxin of toxin-antitoxin system